MDVASGSRWNTEASYPKRATRSELPEASYADAAEKEATAAGARLADAR